uniref:PTTG1 interacting protein n=1 Tax=Cyanoderma ruficeps TaxID=181631 RepID=A0A8C3RFL3_9PASS
MNRCGKGRGTLWAVFAQGQAAALPGRGVERPLLSPPSPASSRCSRGGLAPSCGRPRSRSAPAAPGVSPPAAAPPPPSRQAGPAAPLPLRGAAPGPPPAGATIAAVPPRRVRPRSTMAPALPLCALALALLPAAVTVTAQDVAGDCRQYTNRSCEECLKNVTCLWCASSKRCMEYPVRRILPPADLCELRSARWGVCWVNFEALIIAMSVVGGTLLIMLGVCCCCCCCKKKSKKPDKDDERAAREREKRRVRQEERRAEMKSRHDEIRRKYGLFKEENPYAKFDN